MANAKNETPVPAPDAAATPLASETPGAVVPPKKKSNKALWIIIGLVVFFFVIVPGIVFTAGAVWLNNNASDKLAENAVEGIVGRATGGQVDLDTKDGSFSVQNESGDSTFSVGDDQKLPDDFPKNNIPYLKEKKVTFVFTTSNENKKSWSVSTTVSETFEEAKTFFADKIKAPDYTDISSYGFGESQTYYGVKAPYGVSVTVSQSSDTANNDVSVTYLVNEQ